MSIYSKLMVEAPTLAPPALLPPPLPIAKEHVKKTPLSQKTIEGKRSKDDKLVTDLIVSYKDHQPLKRSGNE